MHNWQAQVQDRLVEWAEWFSAGNVLGLGYRRVIWQGVSRQSTGDNPLPCHSNAEKIEDLVQALMKIDPLLANLLRLHYFHSGSIRIHARTLKITHTKYKNYLDQAHAWIASQLFMKRSD